MLVSSPIRSITGPYGAVEEKTLAALAQRISTVTLRDIAQAALSMRPLVEACGMMEHWLEAAEVVKNHERFLPALARTGREDARVLDVIVNALALGDLDAEAPADSVFFECAGRSCGVRELLRAATEGAPVGAEWVRNAELFTVRSSLDFGFPADETLFWQAREDASPFEPVDYVVEAAVVTTPENSIEDLPLIEFDAEYNSLADACGTLYPGVAPAHSFYAFCAVIYHIEGAAHFISAKATHSLGPYGDAFFAAEPLAEFKVGSTEYQEMEVPLRGQDVEWPRKLDEARKLAGALLLDQYEAYLCGVQPAKRARAE